MRAALTARHGAYIAGDQLELKKSSYDLRKTIKAAKQRYREQIESRFTTNSTRDLWRGLHTIADFKAKHCGAANITASLPDELNCFYFRFDVTNSEPPRKATATTCNLVIAKAEVRRCFQRVDSRKVAGPDGIPGRVLRMCTAQLAGTLPYEYKIVIAGNHELTFDKDFVAELVKQDYYRFPSVSKLKPEDFDNVQSLLTNCIYVQDSEVTVKGFQIYGTPWTPWFNGWGFNLPRGQSLLDKWNLIPEGIDVLMTHGPPLGFRDWVPKELQRVGCVELLNTVQRRVRPKLHVFGGIHEGYGIMTDGYTTYINASTCTVSFQPINPPIIFDLPNPQGS
ncbi:metallophosphoesterase MPPED2a isoform X1 [Mobula hypostoma]|uniref:metallophosphoesterase MPPED2a isoform X1 n=1 Tax=Mobula hypostoma TaxID=723540 RepID=UPI002FC369E4